MKITQHLRHILMSVLCGSTLCSLTLTSANQMALAAHIEKTVNQASTMSADSAAYTYTQSEPVENFTSSIDANIVFTSTGHASALYNTGAINSITGEIVATASDSTYSYSNLAYAIYNSGSIQTIDATSGISATNTYGRAYTINNANSTNSIGTITGTIDANAYSYAFGINNEGTISSVADATIKAYSSNSYARGIHNNGMITSVSNVEITVTGDAGYTSGIYQQSGKIETINNVDIVSSSRDKYAYGIYLNSGTIEAASNISIDASSTGDDTLGIYINSGELTSISDSSIVSTSTADYAYGVQVTPNGTLGTMSDTSIEVKSSANTAYGIKNDGSIDQLNNVDIQVTSESTSSLQYAYGILTSKAISSISGSIVADGAWGSYGIYTSSDAALNFGGDTSIEAKGTNVNYAIYSENNLVLTSLDTEGNVLDSQISITGNIGVNSGKTLSLSSGNYQLLGSVTIKASGITISSDSSLTIDGTVTLSGTDTLTFDIVGDVTQSLLSITETGSIEGLTTIIVNLDETASAEWEASDEALAIIDAQTAAELENVTFSVVTYGSTESTSVEINQLVGEFITVPEPSTASLSLLALAGLCMRRRRRQA